MTMCLSFLTFVSPLRVYYATNRRVSCHDNDLFPFETSVYTCTCIYMYVLYIIDHHLNMEWIKQFVLVCIYRGPG